MPQYLGLASLLRANLSGTDLAPLCQTLIQRATDDPNDAYSLMDAGVIFQFYGNQQAASSLQQEALRTQRLYHLPAQQTPKIRVLALMAPGNLQANVPIECLVENSDIDLHIYYATTGENDLSVIPDHDVLFIALSDSETNRPIIENWLPVLVDWPRPIVNNPFNINRVARDTASQLLHNLPGVAMPPTLRMSREALQSWVPEGEMNFPLIVRPIDSHAGHNMNKVDTPAMLADALSTMPDDAFFVSPFIDYRGNDRLFRKYRVILIDGQPFACHMAISNHWMIHYLNAGMADNPERRAEEAQFMAGFEQDFAVRHANALSAIHQAIGLDYLGIDCAETADGRLLVFEVDHAMVVHDMDPVDLYPYKPATIHKLFAAFRTMLVNATTRPVPTFPLSH